MFVSVPSLAQIKSISLQSWSVGGRLWQESTSLRNDQGEEFKLNDDLYGVTTGFQHTTYKKDLSFRHEVYGFFGQAHVASADSRLTYFEKGVTTMGLGFSESLVKLAVKATAEYGINLDVFFRRILLPDPDANISVQDIDRFLIIIGPQLRWQISGKIFLDQRIGYSPQANDVVWSFGLAYRGNLW